MKIRVLSIRNSLKEYLLKYASENNMKYSRAIKILAKAVDRNHRYIYSIVSQRSQASGELQFAIAKFFNTRVDDIFLPVLSENDERQLQVTRKEMTAIHKIERSSTR
jgi:DNA-binding XRE family transcriptional regulator